MKGGMKFQNVVGGKGEGGVADILQAYFLKENNF